MLVLDKFTRIVTVLQVVLSPATHTYLDHPYEPDPEERGLCWAARFVDTKKVFAFQPDSFYDNMDFLTSGEPLDKETACAEGTVKCVPLEKPHNVVGRTSHSWPFMFL